MTPHRERTKPWYGTGRWKARRAHCLLTANYLCQMCLKRGHVKTASVADHIEPHKGDPDKFWNGELMAICATCHNSDKQRIERGGKPRLRIGPDGWPIENGT